MKVRQPYLMMSASAVALLHSICWAPIAALADPFKLNASETGAVQGTGAYDYPAPQVVQPMQGSAVTNTLHGGTQQQQLQPQRPAYQPPPSSRPPIQATIQKQVQLPPGYLGVWNVQGRRTTVDALPEFQAAAQQFMAPSTNNTWQITGSPGNYQMGNGQMSTPLIVDRVDANGTAYIRYQHPVIKVMAQEAIVLSLSPNGMTFSGLERVSILKQGESQPRAKVTYELMGQRQR